MENTKTIRVTKAQRNSDIMALLEGKPVQFGTTVEDAIAHLTHENELLVKKNSSDAKKPTKTQLENIKIKDNIIAYLESHPKQTATQVSNALGLDSNQKSARLLNDLCREGRAVRTEEKNKALFSANPDYTAE